MKKNLMSVLILALVVANLVFTAVLTFSILPSTKNANKLIEDVSQAINLELNAGKTTGQNNVPVGDLEAYNVDAGEKLTITLKKDSDGTDHFAVVSVYLSLNSKHDDYATFAPTMDSKVSMIKSFIINAVSARTKAEINDSEVQAEVLEEILENLQALYNSDFIVAVGFSSFLVQ